MNTSTASHDTIKFIFPYDENKFAKTISRMNPTLIGAIRISVWAHSSDGHYVNILKSTLSGTEFDQLAANALYTTYEGNYLDLAKIGLA